MNQLTQDVSNNADVCSVLSIQIKNLDFRLINLDKLVREVLLRLPSAEESSSETSTAPSDDDEDMNVELAARESADSAVPVSNMTIADPPADAEPDTSAAPPAVAAPDTFAAPPAVAVPNTSADPPAVAAHDTSADAADPDSLPASLPTSSTQARADSTTLPLAPSIPDLVDEVQTQECNDTTNTAAADDIAMPSNPASPHLSSTAPLSTSPAADHQNIANSLPVLNLQPPTPQTSQESVPITPTPIPLRTRSRSPLLPDAPAAPAPSSSQLKPPSAGPMTRSRSQSCSPPSVTTGKRKTDDSGPLRAGKRRK